MKIEKQRDWLGFVRKHIAQMLLVAFLIFFTYQRPDAFLSVTNFMNIARQVATMGIVALGMSFVMLTGGLDFSVGSMVALSGIVSALLIKGAGVPIYPAFAIAIICCMVASAITGVVGVLLDIPILVVSIAMQQILNGFNSVITGNQSIYGFEEPVKFLGQGELFGFVPVPVVLLVICAAIVNFVLSKTYLGRHLFTVGGNQRAAKLAGINVIRTRIVASVVCGFMSGFAGVVLMSRTASASASVGGTMASDVITAAVLGGVSIIGGVGNTSGVITGVLIIGILNNGLQLMNVDSTIQNIIKGIILLLAVSLDSIARKQRERKKLLNN
ncbi:MAG: ABC transporter permease [Oscillospiraceae bacterium]|jgi:ribose transport system permease protein